MPGTIHILRTCRRAGPPLGHHRRVRPSDQAVRDALTARGGIVSRAQLLAVDVSASAIARRVKSGELCVVVPGVYRAAATPLTPDLRLRATVLRVPTAVVTGRWAAWWHDLAGPTIDPVAIIVPPGAYPPAWRDLTVQRRSLDRADRQILRGLPVTTRARTVLDCAGRPDAEDIRDRALQRGTTILSLETALQRMTPSHGTTAARRLVEPVRRGGVSPPERELRQALTQVLGSRWRCGMRVRAGGRECWLDLAVEEIRLVVEVDGWTVHSRGEAYHSDRVRQNALIRAGWTVLRYTPRQVCDDLQGVVGEIRTMEAKLLAVRGR
jgi:very-short-patch-repair endonuclease